MTALIRTVGCLLLAACGGPLKPSAWEGAPLFTIQGTLVDDPVEYVDPPLGALRYAFFWVAGESFDAEDRILVEDEATTRRFTAPSAFTLHLHHRPAELGSRGYTVGMVLIYDDRDGDGRRDADEPLRGGALSALVAYAPEPRPADDTELLLDLPRGFSVFAGPMVCYGETLDGAFPDCEVDVEVGDGCFSDEQCDDDAHCAESVIATPLPGGMCVVLSESPHDQSEVCAEGGRFLQVFGGSWLREIEPVDGVWLPACERDEDCARRGYHCAAATGVCLPEPRFDVVRRRPDDLPPLCVQGFEDRREDVDED